jgi:hypothetical protein
MPKIFDFYKIDPETRNKRMGMISKITLVVCILIGVFLGCQEDTQKEYMSEGKILGPDLRMCPSSCCGGWYIQIESTTYEFDALPAGSNINLQTSSFPIAVKLDWSLSDKIACPDKRIIIQRIAKITTP